MLAAARIYAHPTKSIILFILSLYIVLIMFKHMLVNKYKNRYSFDELFIC